MYIIAAKTGRLTIYADEGIQSHSLPSLNPNRLAGRLGQLRNSGKGIGVRRVISRFECKECNEEGVFQYKKRYPKWYEETTDNSENYLQYLLHSFQNPTPGFDKDGNHRPSLVVSLLLLSLFLFLERLIDPFLDPLGSSPPYCTFRIIDLIPMLNHD